MSHHRRNNDQHSLIDNYTNLYNQNARQIERLLDLQHDITIGIRQLTNDQFYNTNTRQNTRPTTPPAASTNEGGNTYSDSATGRNIINGVAYSLDYFINDYESQFPRNNIPSGSLADVVRTNFENLYSNVIVRPTNRQVLNATRNIVFSQIQGPLNTSCPISLEPFDENNEVTQILGCGHIFHPSNLQTWFDRNVRCPICRFDIRTSLEQTSNEETKEENGVEESKDNEEREDQNSVSSTDTPNNVIVDGLTNLTEAILTRLISPSNSTRFGANIGNSRVTYDVSANEIIFQGFYS